MLHYFAFLVTLFFSTSLFSSSLDITILTSKSEDRQSAGKSFTGITVKPHRPVLRAVELAVFESSTLFETIGIQAEIQQLELLTEIDYQQQLKSISPGSLVIMDLPLNIMEQVARVATIVDQRTFSLSHHPDDRDKNRPEFLTGGISYDVVAVIDSNKDYGRYLQYSTRSARPVVGDVGLTPTSWHVALERYGAPQLNERYRQFKKDEPLSSQVAMTDAEFAAWSAVKLITNSINTRQHTDDLDLLSVLNDPASQVDLYKGTRGSIRRWNHQLRQPILLAAPEAVIAVAPMPKFLHPKHYVDTLGVDEPESKCQLQ